MPGSEDDRPGGQGVTGSTVGGDATRNGSARGVDIGTPSSQALPGSAGVGDGRWAKPITTATVLVGIAIGLVGNLATGTVEVSGIWVPVTWATTGLQVAAAVILPLLQALSASADSAVVLERALAAGAQAVGA